MNRRLPFAIPRLSRTLTPQQQNARENRRSARKHAWRLRKARIAAYLHANASTLAAFAVLALGWLSLTYAVAEFCAGVRFSTPWLAVGDGTGGRRIVWACSLGVLCLWLTGRRVLSLMWTYGAAHLGGMSDTEVQRALHPPAEE